MGMQFCCVMEIRFDADGKIIAQSFPQKTMNHTLGKWQFNEHEPPSLMEEARGKCPGSDETMFESFLPITKQFKEVSIL